MKMNPLVAVLAAAMGVVTSGCETEDVTPRSKVRMELGTSIILENSGSTEIRFTLEDGARAPVTVEIALGGTADQNTDYSVSAMSVEIPATDSVGIITLNAIDDSDQEGNEIVEISVASIVGGVSIGVSDLTLTIEDDDVVQPLNLVLNEVLYDPSNNGLDGDANGDGAYVHAQDEFIELVNLSASNADISGFKVFDDENYAIDVPNHEFPAGTVIPPGGALVLFGGGTPTGTFGNATIQTSTSGDMNLNNAGDVLRIVDLDDNVIIEFDIEPLSNNPNESYTRDPDLTGEFVQHANVNGALFSPGTRTDGTPF